MKTLTRFDITQNPNMRKRAERTAVCFKLPKLFLRSLRYYVPCFPSEW